MASIEILKEAAKLFDSSDKWRAFCELSELKQEIVENWVTEFARKVAEIIRNELSEIEGMHHYKNEYDKERVHYWRYNDVDKNGRPRGVSVILEMKPFEYVQFGLYSNIKKELRKPRWQEILEQNRQLFEAFGESTETDSKTYLDNLPKCDWPVYEDLTIKDLTHNDPAFWWYVGNYTSAAAQEVLERIRKYLNRHGKDLIRLNEQINAR